MTFCDVTGKIMFKSYHNAFKVIQHHKKNHTKRKGQNVYKCDYCHHWHTGKYLKKEAYL